MEHSGPLTLPLFPLGTHVLPGGRLPLRIFEPRYLRMVKEACRSGLGFGMCMLNPRGAGALHSMYAIGTWVQVIDFATLADGLLGITVEGQQCFRIEQLWQEQDGLRRGQVRYLPEWPPLPLVEPQQPLQQLLVRLYAEHEPLGRLYPTPLPADAAWLCQRWLELLPMQPALKQRLALEDSPAPCLDSLQAWMSHHA